MSTRTWHHVVIDAPLIQTNAFCTGTIRTDGSVLDVLPTATAEAAFFGPDARRYPGVWTSGRWTGAAYVEVRPWSRRLTEVVVHLRAPDGALARLVWTRAPLDALSEAFGRELRTRARATKASRDAHPSGRTDAPHRRAV